MENDAEEKCQFNEECSELIHSPKFIGITTLPEPLCLFHIKSMYPSAFIFDNIFGENFKYLLAWKNVHLRTVEENDLRYEEIIGHLGCRYELKTPSRFTGNANFLLSPFGAMVEFINVKNEHTESGILCCLIRKDSFYLRKDFVVEYLVKRKRIQMSEFANRYYDETTGGNFLPLLYIKDEEILNIIAQSIKEERPIPLSTVDKRNDSSKNSGYFSRHRHFVDADSPFLYEWEDYFARKVVDTCNLSLIQKTVNEWEEV